MLSRELAVGLGAPRWARIHAFGAKLAPAPFPNWVKSVTGCPGNALQSPNRAGIPSPQRWPGPCLIPSMSEITYQVRGKNGDYVTTTVVPANHSAEPHFGALDIAVLGVVGACLVVGLVLLLL
jgi:hypothetical protein